ncbi:DUF2064 domain-containing protein [Microlunatus elymi]|uniref:DUF2064 domain-containing protein n=1 Tax=Microlunatus elymi TaxID=2596828 RepID=A0A516PYA8_9ACTN|nr:DUF2064 domain-containing protein [Microlunatus elymi]QDP96153.1 DUF2064 domain-containing protein [Microlunatus elymi]
MITRSGLRDRAETVIVLAKEPLPGRAKTRLQRRFSPSVAAQLAEASLTDTLSAVRAAAISRRILAWEGNPDRWRTGFAVLEQGDGDLGRRLARVFDAVFALAPDRPALLIAMDTPQVTAAELEIGWDGADAVLGLAADGGYWAIGLRSGPARPVFDDIEMSTERTGAAQLARLLDLGLRVKLLPPLLDLDTPADAAWITEHHPELGFARRYRELTATSADAGMIFDRAYAGRGLRVETAAGVDPLRTDLAQWMQPADSADLLVVARCQPPVLDVGCGPGRLVTALIEHGQPALGIDLSGTAVTTSLGRGGPALRRDIGDRLPAEGRWGTVLLMDSNAGIGGDVDALLRRCLQLAEPGGLIICETDPDDDADEVHTTALCSGTATTSVRWARIGAAALARRAARLDLAVVEHWSGSGRSFVALRTM